MIKILFPILFSSLNYELKVISILETNGGLNLSHQKSGTNTAFGEYGLKPDTAYGFYTKKVCIKKSDFLLRFKNEKTFYDEIALGYWKNLREDRTPTRAAYAWRYGEGAELKATDFEVESSEYVVKFKKWILNVKIR